MTRFLKSEPAFVFCLLTVTCFLITGNKWLTHESISLYIINSIWILVTTFISAFSVVRHSDILALKMGEPFGTLVLTLSVICMEVIIIVSVMASGKPDPTLARDTMYSVIMIVMNGLVGITLLIGGYRFHTQFFNLMGAKSYLVVITPLALLCLVLPNFLIGSHEPIFTHMQPLFLIVLSMMLYGVFLLIQTSSHSHFFTDESGHSTEKDQYRKGNLYHSLLLIFYLLTVVVLAKRLAVPIDDITAILNAPPAVSGFIIAALILSPEAAGAIRAALSNKLQRAVNIYLGSVLATIALTVPAVLLIGYMTDHTVILGLPPAEMVILLITLMLAHISFSGGKTNVLNGATHMVIFFVYLMVIFD